MLKKQLSLVFIIFWSFVLMINIMRTSNSNRNTMRDAIQAEKISWKECFDIVITGDSRTLIDISPQAMQKVLTNYKIGNLGFIELMYSQEYMDYVKNTLRPTARNKVIIIGFSPRSFLLREKENCNFLKVYKEARMPLNIELERHSGWLKALFRELDTGDLDITYFKTNYKNLIFYFKSGWMASRRYPENAKLSNDQYRDFFKKGGIDEELLEVLYRNTKAWSQEGIKVFGIRIPVSPKLFIIEKKKSGFDEEKIRRQFEKCGGIWLSPVVKNAVAFDGSHLRYDSAVYYSQSLAKEIKKYLKEK